MKNKMHVVEAVGIVLMLICGIIIYFNTTLKSQSSEKVIGYEKFRSISVLTIDSNYIDWVDNFDTSYVDKTTGCIVYTRK